MRYLFPLLLSAVAIPPLYAQASWNVRGHISLEKLLVQAHRGAGELSEENTPEAFQLGWKLNCIPEADIRQTKDGVIVAFHDANFARVVKGIEPAMAKKGVADITFAELQKLDVGSWKGEQFAGRRVSRMTDIFALMKGKPERRLYLDYKKADLKQLAQEIKEYGVGKQVIFATTSYPTLREWKKLLPDSETLLWIGGTDEKLTQRFEEIRKTNFADITQVQIHVHLKKPAAEIQRDDVNPFQESDNFLRERSNELRQKGILFQSLPWGGSTEAIYWKLLDLGVMSFATDHPDVTWEALKKYYK